MSQSRRYHSRMQQAIRMRRIIYAAVGALVVLVLVAVLIGKLAGRDDATNPLSPEGAPQQQATMLPGQVDPDAPQAPEDAPIESTDPTPEPVKLLPIIDRNRAEKKRIAITIDDCFQEKNVRAIIKLAEKYNADLTFFPKGETIKGNAQLWRDIYEKGYQIENHSYHHTNITDLTDEALRETIVLSEKALNEALGINYHMSMFRCPTGDGIRSDRLHRILRELDYKAVASWALSGSQDTKKLLPKVQPGQILLFHATDADLARLKVVIPALVKKGYKLVSVNTLYGKENNAVTPLETYDH